MCPDRKEDYCDKYLQNLTKERDVYAYLTLEKFTTSEDSCETSANLFRIFHLNCLNPVYQYMFYKPYKGFNNYLDYCLARAYSCLLPIYPVHECIEKIRTKISDTVDESEVSDLLQLSKYNYQKNIIDNVLDLVDFNIKNHEARIYQLLFKSKIPEMEIDYVLNNVKTKCKLSPVDSLSCLSSIRKLYEYIYIWLLL